MRDSYLVLDIETYKSDRAEEYWDAKDLKPDSRLKDPAKIEADIAQKRAAGIERSALSPITGRVTMVGLSHNGDTHIITHQDERALLEDLSVFVAGKPTDVYVTKNGTDFDLPFLRIRYMAHGLTLPYWLTPKCREHFDIARQFGRNMGTFGPSLKDLEFVLNIRRDGEKNALQALTWWEEGDIESLARYCEQDVTSTEAIYLKLMGY